MPPGTAISATRCFTYTALKNGGSLKRSKDYVVLAAKKFGKCPNPIDASVEKLMNQFMIEMKFHTRAGKSVERNFTKILTNPMRNYNTA